MGTDREGPVLVGIGLIHRENRWLIRRRPVGSIMAGYWEFPGGKAEPGESAREATRRECREETGLDVVVGVERRTLSHRYEHAWVEIHYYDAETVDPTAEPEPDTGFVWVEGSELSALRFPEANEPILAELARFQKESGG